MIAPDARTEPSELQRTLADVESSLRIVALIGHQRPLDRVRAAELFASLAERREALLAGLRVCERGN